MEGLESTWSFFRQEKKEADNIPISKQKHNNLEILMTTVL